MLVDIHPKLPMRSKEATRDYYINNLGFVEVGEQDHEGYLMVKKDQIEIHFFEFSELDPLKNYGQVYIRTENIESLYSSMIAQNIAIHPNGSLSSKPWGQREFALLDPDNNLLTFGESIEL